MESFTLFISDCGLSDLHFLFANACVSNAQSYAALDVEEEEEEELDGAENNNTNNKNVDKNRVSGAGIMEHVYFSQKEAVAVMSAKGKHRRSDFSGLSKSESWVLFASLCMLLFIYVYFDQTISSSMILCDPATSLA